MSSRWLVGTVCGALLLYAIGAIPSLGPGSVSRASAAHSKELATPPPASQSDALSYERDYLEFGQQLAEFCSGDGSNRTELELIAQRMAEQHGRRDALRVIEYYKVLRPADRIQGLAAHEEVDGFHNRAEARNALDWQAERPALLADIESFVARTLPAPEFSAAGNALALASEIRVDWSAASRREVTSDEEYEARCLRAKREALEAIALFDRAGMQTPKLRPLLQLGRLAVLEAQEARARELFEQCLRMARDCRREEYEVDALVALIHMARSAGDQPELETRLNELARLRSPEESWELAREHAMLWLHRDRPEQAAEFLIRHRPEDPDDLRVWRQILTSVRLRMGDLDGALSLFNSLEKNGMEEDEDWILLRSTLDLARDKPSAVIYRLQGTRAAIASFSQRGRSRAEVLLGEAHLMAGDPALALEALGRARALAESWEARMDEARPTAGSGATVLGEWLGMHAVVLEAKALCQLDRVLEAAVLIERAHGFRWRKAARADQLGSNAGQDSLTSDDLLAWACHYDLGLVTWISGANDALALHITPQGVATAFEIDLPRRDLNRATQRYREALIRQATERHTQLGKELLGALLPPSLRAAIKAQEGEQPRLLLLPHGELELLPFEALPYEAGVLDDSIVLIALPELPSKRPGQRKPDAREWSLIGDPVNADGQQRLPGAGLELSLLEGAHSFRKRISGPDMTSQAVLEALSAGQSLHIATHLAPSDDCSSPRFSAQGLELSWGEVLCATTIAQQQTNSDLVVLATCASAGGRHLDGRGLQGMARAFLDGGTRNLLVTLWPIRDDIASRFSIAYHDSLRSGNTPAVAAQHARRTLAKAGVAAVDWAAFRAIGRE